ncbi:MAG TPA: thiolase family protein, partial [Verrucomicrobiae bacterium]|nr:thiolase family protein [Verrucomicrobiae bacterium]
APLRYHDFCPMSDGVAAVILTSRPTDVVVAGVGSATDIPTIADRNYFHSFPATVAAAAQAYGMAGIADIREFPGRMHVNMHDPFNGFGPINMIDLGLLRRRNLMDGLLEESLTGESGRFPTNLTGGLKGRGHPLGATGMIQIVENHRLMTEKGFDAGLSHSIGGPINNNVVILLEKEAHYDARSPKPFRPRRLPELGKLKPKGVTLEKLLAEQAEGTLVASTTRFDHRNGEPLNSIIIVSCRTEGETYRFLFGLGPEGYQTICSLKAGDRLSIERQQGQILVNRVPVKRFYHKTLEGLVELAGTLKKLGKGKG